MIKLDELPDDTYVVWFGQPWDQYCTPDIEIEVPSEELCHECMFAIGHKTTGAAVKDDEGRWLYYHRDCYWEMLHEKAATEVVADGLDAEDLEDFR